MIMPYDSFVGGPDIYSNLSRNIEWLLYKYLKLIQSLISF